MVHQWLVEPQPLVTVPLPVSGRGGRIPEFSEGDPPTAWDVSTELFGPIAD